MTDNKLNDMITTALSHVQELANTDTVVGERMELGNGTIVIPISKVSLGFVSGGMDYLSKHDKQQAPRGENNYGGGGGTGISVVPIGFLVAKADGNVEFLPITNAVPVNGNVVDSVSALLEKSPDIVQKFKEIFSKKKKKEPRQENTDAKTAEE